MPTPSKQTEPSKPSELKEIAQQKLPPEPKANRIKQLDHQEQKAKDKLDRIKEWPKEHQAVASERTQQKLNQIREEKSKLAK